MNEDWEESLSYAPKQPEEEFDGAYQDEAEFADLEKTASCEVQRDLPYDEEDYFDSQEQTDDFANGAAYDDYQSMPEVYGDAFFGEN